MRGDQGSEVKRDERRVRRRNSRSTEQKTPARPAEAFRGYELNGAQEQLYGQRVEEYEEITGLVGASINKYEGRWKC